MHSKQIVKNEKKGIGGMFNFEVISMLEKTGVNTIRFKLKAMRYISYIKQSETEIAEAFATGDAEYAIAEVSRVEKERHEYHNQAIDAVKELNRIAKEHGFEAVYQDKDYRRDIITNFCYQYLARS